MRSARCGVERAHMLSSSLVGCWVCAKPSCILNGDRDFRRIFLVQGLEVQTHGWRVNEVQSKLNTTALKRLAGVTNGKYFEINQSRNDVNKLINTINLIEGELRDSKNIDTKSNKYFYFLIFAAFLLLGDVLITLKIISL